MFALVSPGHLCSFFTLKLRIFSSSEKFSRTQCHSGITSACDLHGHVAWTCQTGPMVFVQGILFSLKLRIFSSSEKSSRTMPQRHYVSLRPAWACCVDLSDRSDGVCARNFVFLETSDL